SRTPPCPNPRLSRAGPADANGLSGAGAPDRRPRAAPRRLRSRRPRHRAPARVPPARSDRDGRATPAPRPLEPARRIRHGRARPAALGGTEALRVRRLRLSDRVAAADPGAHPPVPPREAVQARPVAPRVLANECGVPALRAPRARAARAAALTRARGPLGPRPSSAQLVREPLRRPDAGGAPRPRRDRRGRAAERPAALGRRLALVSEDGDRAVARGGAHPRGAAFPRPRRPLRAGRVARAPGCERRAGARSRHAPLAVRPARPRPR